MAKRKNYKQRPQAQKFTFRIDFRPQTQNQGELHDLLGECTVVCATGPAGTGKTYTTVTKAAQALVGREIDKIILARANVATGKSLGAVPGDLDDKLEPWMMPMLDVLREHLGAGELDYQLKKKNIQMVSLETIRGRSFKDSFIIVDEAQQLSIAEIKAISTRIGEGSTLVLMGDPDQSDLRGKSGYSVFTTLLKDKRPTGMEVVEFGLDDIVRSGACAQLVRLFMEAKL